MSTVETFDPKIQAFLEAAPDAIVVVDASGRIVAINALTESMFGWSRSELLGKLIETLVPPRYRDRHHIDRESYSRNPHTRPMGLGRDLLGRRKNGSEFSVEISLSPLQSDVGSLVVSIVRDVTERRRVEEQIQASLREKEALLREIHHRVKNNLQVTSSLLRLQAGRLEDERSREVFAATQHRLRSMALVHEKLYQSSNLSRVNLGEYLQTLGELLFKSYGVDANSITFDVEGAEVLLNIDVAVPCGLIANELISNALKHAFPNGRKGAVNVLLRLDEPQCTLTISDDGVGLRQGGENDPNTLGLQLVSGLVKQLEGSLEIARNGGTRFIVRFPCARGTHG